MDESSKKRGTLFVIGTPIGNLNDITLRAIEVLKGVDRVAAEDTRQTRRLLSRLHISKPMLSYHEFNEQKRGASIIRSLLEGTSIALVSDAGTPGISDPGYRLVRDAIQHDIAVVPIPGPSAILAALSASGLPTDSFVFEGFLEGRETRRRKQLERLKEEERTIILFESPHRVLKGLQAVLEILGNRPICLARELTKIHEELLRGDVAAVLENLKKRGRIKGEITLIIQGKGRKG
ncbi:MAG: 16S rRNA (cytidine(1402)-2'-O)-methyltransferase [bacterium]